jgi:hypothetical protein
VQWAQLKHYAEGELAKSAGWDVKAGEQEFEASRQAEAKDNKPK